MKRGSDLRLSAKISGFISTDRFQVDWFLVSLKLTPLATYPKNLNIFVKLHLAQG